ncbi:SDR family NAD(P)-dependent oxidoreductase [Clostridium culturomicium]|uniref:SDR family NAD(P)-dependent oxidoreductase n=1 Tax=Clostridium culturomicium TaxID=1499683 RepID=UPI00058CBDDC|nr:SDR family oxidoreductase [Clostridium culturomicium]
MKVLITGASSGIGRDMAEIYSNKGYELILVARSKDKLELLANKLKTKVKIIQMDLSIPENCFRLYDLVKDEEIDILINNAGYGVFGKFLDTDLNEELNMIDLNIKAVHILTKLFLRAFKEKNKGSILNVASSAAFSPGPLFSSYYASKAYVVRLTEALYEELRRENSRVYIGALCPGPVDTNFNDRANVAFNLKGLKSYDVADYAIRKMEEGKLIIIPGTLMKISYCFTKITPNKMMLKAAYKIQKKKC